MSDILLKLTGIGVLSITNVMAERLNLRKTEQITNVGLIGVLTYTLIDATIDFVRALNEAF